MTPAQTRAVWSSRRIQMGPVPVDCLSFDEALDAITSMVASRRGGTVFTPNVDHVVLASSNAAFRHAYEGVDLSLADGMPIVWASRLYPHRAPEKVSGSDLVPRLLERANRLGWRVFLFGGAEGVARKAALQIQHRHPGLTVVGTASPAIDMAGPASQRTSFVENVRAATPDLVLVALGAPKQELWIAESAGALRPAVLLGIGASLDFIAGTASRAPAWLSSLGLEWLYRLAHDPLRLATRYLLRDPRFPLVLWRDRAQVRAEGRGAR